MQIGTAAVILAGLVAFGVGCAMIAVPCLDRWRDGKWPWAASVPIMLGLLMFAMTGLILAAGLDKP